MFSKKYSALFKVVFLAIFVYLTYLLVIEMPVQQEMHYLDKLQHIIAFGGVAAIGVLAFPAWSKALGLVLSVYGGLMEVVQGLVTTTRKASVYDWMADNVGIVLGVVLTMAFLRWYQKKHGRI